MSLQERDASVARDEVRGIESVVDSIESHLKPLTARQIHAINLLSMGKTVVATARSLDIGVSTLHRWKATHPLFKAELAQRQHNLFDEMINKLRLTMGKAVDQLFAMMTGDSKLDRKEVMFEMLKLLKPQKFLVPSEPSTASAVLDEDVRANRASRGEVVGTEVTDEDRIAAIPAEFRVDMKESDENRATTAQANEYIAPVYPESTERDLQSRTASDCHAERTREASATDPEKRRPVQVIVDESKPQSSDAPPNSTDQLRTGEDSSRVRSE